jgi:hypothetical protein
MEGMLPPAHEALLYRVSTSMPETKPEQGQGNMRICVGKFYEYAEAG